MESIVGIGKNSSTLTLSQCRSILANLYTVFSAFSDADLDSLYFVAYGRWAYHLTRDGYVYWLGKYQLKNAVC